MWPGHHLPLSSAPGAKQSGFLLCTLLSHPVHLHPCAVATAETELHHLDAQLHHVKYMQSG